MMHNERRWLAVSAIGLSLFLSALGGTIVALALPPIARHFQLSASLVSTVTLGPCDPADRAHSAGGRPGGPLPRTPNLPGRRSR